MKTKLHIAIPLLVLAACAPMPGMASTPSPTIAIIESPRVAPTLAQSLRGAAFDRKILIGAGGANPDPLRTDPAYGQTMAREFSALTPGNAMKFGPIHPAPDTYDFRDADAFVDFAQANAMQVRGHTLVWHDEQPKWLEQGTFTRDQLLAIMRDHIATVVGRYRGRIYAWDVVNEAINDDGTMRESFWYKTIGPDYIDQAFRFAHEADPNAKLIYNDYAAEGSGTKSDAVYAMVKGMKERGVPIDGVGLQSHFTITPPRLADIDANIKRLSALGLDVHITELDVRLRLPADAAALAQQASVYRDYLRMCLANSNCRMFVLWGFTDKYSWIPGKFPGFGAGLIFDEQYDPKPAYYAMMDVLNGK